MLRANDLPVQYDPQKAEIPILPETERRAFNPSSHTSNFVKFLLTLTSWIGASGIESGSIEWIEKSSYSSADCLILSVIDCQFTSYFKLVNDAFELILF